ncbi:hypothetical protein NZK35_15375 [Stieleria sp. ICT_E10.1]|uniref:hypothetical protein n=1 Tax=Stieleria sedimenti TaxID=2976331 RepID=UPI00217F36A2|nr:hypothetical protein [Stieleria sedimenti]MCS7468033.1 hypothetical protein [Stieleria sedimenti]
MNFDRHNLWRPCRGLCHRLAGFRVAMLSLAIIAMLQPAFADQRPQQKDADDQRVIDSTATDRPKKRTVRRNKRLSRERKSDRAKHPKPSPNDAPVRVQLNGSFELDLGSGNAIRGDGNITIELDRATAERLGAVSIEHLDDGTAAATEFLQMVTKLPGMLEQTAEILKLLSNPETQQNLRQVEQVLRLLPSGMLTPATAP